MANLNCKRCNASWTPRSAGTIPKNCPRCNSPYWQTPRKNVVSVVNSEAATPRDLKQYVCRLQRCGHTWTSRIETLPKVCPKCHSKNWNVEITPQEAREYLDHMFRSISGDIYDFARVIRMDVEVLRCHLRGEPMSLFELNRIAEILRGKGGNILTIEERRRKTIEVQENAVRDKAYVEAFYAEREKEA